MADIKLNDLSTQNFSGSDLFEDSESFLTELNDESNQVSKEALARVIGGGTCFCTGFELEQPVLPVLRGVLVGD
jgi:hypothetical protein